MHHSLQFPGDNPKDSDDWVIYPPPPPPSYPPSAYKDGKFPNQKYDEEDFDPLKIPIPGKHTVR